MTDKEKLEKARAEIERRKKLHEDSLTNPIHQGFGLQKVINAKISELTYLLSFIDSMQEEPINENLEEEIKRYFNEQPIMTRSKGVDYKLIPSAEKIANHFFELGLKAQKGGL